MNQPRDNFAAELPGRSHTRRTIGIIALIFLLPPVLAAGIFMLSFNPGRYAPALIAALSQATGRKVTLNGPVTIAWSLTPSLQAQDLELSNPPGFPGQNMLTLGSLRADIALLPLFSHRVDILRLVLVSPRLTLERLPNGTANWDFSTPDKNNPRHHAFFTHSGYKIAVEAVQIQDGLLTISSGNPATATSIQLNSLTGTADSLAAPLHLTALAEIGATPFGISGIVGPIERFSGIGDTPWPIDLDATLAGAKLNITGTVQHPRSARGYSLALNLAVPNLAVLGQALPAGLLHGLTLPPVQNLTATAHLTDSGAAIPNIDDFSLKAGNSDLSSVRSGLILSRLDIEMPSLGQPVSLAINGISGSGPFSLQGQFGALASLLNPAWLPATPTPPSSFPVSLSAQLGAATASVTGTIATPQTLSGAALAVTASIPDLSVLSQAAGIALPAWKNITAQTNLIDPGGQGFYNAAGLDSLTVTMDNAAFGGAASFYVTPQPRLQLALSFSQANIDALLAAFPPPPPPPAGLPPAPAPQPAAAPASSNIKLIPDTPLPFGLLKTGSADIQLAADNVTWNGSLYTALQAHAGLGNGVLTVDQLTGELPGGTVSATASLNVTTDPAAETLQLKAPALALAPLFKLLHLPGTGEGTLQAQFSAASTGDTLHTIATNLNGQLGLASVNDVISTNLLAQAFGPALAKAGISVAANPPNAALRCFGLRLDAAKGVATLQTLTLDSDHLFVQGSGSIDLGQESYNVTLQPATGVPIQLGGSFAQPTLTASSPPVPATAPTTPMPDACPAALALARLGQPGPAASPPTGTAPASAAPANGPKNLLNSLLGP